MQKHLMKRTSISSTCSSTPLRNNSLPQEENPSFKYSQNYSLNDTFDQDLDQNQNDISRVSFDFERQKKDFDDESKEIDRSVREAAKLLKQTNLSLPKYDLSTLDKITEEDSDQTQKSLNFLDDTNISNLEHETYDVSVNFSFQKPQNLFTPQRHGYCDSVQSTPMAREKFRGPLQHLTPQIPKRSLETTPKAKKNDSSQSQLLKEKTTIVSEETSQKSFMANAISDAFKNSDNCLNPVALYDTQNLMNESLFSRSGQKLDFSDQEVLASHFIRLQDLGQNQKKKELKAISLRKETENAIFAEESTFQTEPEETKKRDEHQQRNKSHITYRKKSEKNSRNQTQAIVFSQDRERNKEKESLNNKSTMLETLSANNLSLLKEQDSLDKLINPFKHSYENLTPDGFKSLPNAQNQLSPEAISFNSRLEDKSTDFWLKSRPSYESISNFKNIDKNEKKSNFDLLEIIYNRMLEYRETADKYREKCDLALKNQIETELKYNQLLIEVEKLKNKKVHKD